MAVQGIELPVSLLIKNLLDITNLIKAFAGKNLLADSLGGKKIDQELSKVMSRLEQISAKAKTALTTLGDFNSILKDVNALEIGLNKILDAAKSIRFEDLKIPDDALAKIDGLNARISELLNNLISFKGTQKEKIISDLGFLSNLNMVAGPKEAAKMLLMGYDELYKTINTGMTKINTLLEMKAAAYRQAQETVTLNSNGKAAMTQWGAVGFLLEAFKSLPKDDSKKNDVLKLMEQYMNYSSNEKGLQQFSGFLHGAAGESQFLKLLRTQFELTPQQTQDMIKRMLEQAKILEGGMKAVWQKLGADGNFAANMVFGAKRTEVETLKNLYAADLNALSIAKQDLQDYQAKSGAYNQMQKSFDLPNKEIAAKAEEIGTALQLPQRELEALKNLLVSAALASPEFSLALMLAGGEITKLGQTIDVGKTKLALMDQTLSKMLGVLNFINRYLGLYAIVRRVTSFIRNAISNIKELDKNITNIAVVTNMSQKDLWGKIGEYTNMAQQFGVATKDVYTVSLLFYQLGLQTSQVMSLTTETLKMAKISGMDFADAANAMTVAVRAFNIDMQDALQVTDTYSALAAKFAVSSAEIANAMEKTASSAANVGMSLQSTSAFISVMEQTTREGAQNIGSALKSIISRYGEMKASPSSLIDADGEETSFNKVDTALKSIGISIKDSSGQFRNFDDVIMELSKKWDTLDNNTLRYIATVMAGNRQQSRFIALVSNYDELSRAMNTANNAENASIVLTAKTMDSLESKTNLLKNAFSQLYLDLHIEDALKGAYDVLTRIVTTIGKMSKGKLGIFGGLVPTLLNVVNAGVGMKNLIGMAKNAYQHKRNTVQQKVDADTKEAESKINALILKAEKEHIMPVKTTVDTTALDAQEARIQMAANPQLGSFLTGLNLANPNGPGVAGLYKDLLTTGLAGGLATQEQRDAFLGKYGVEKGTELYNTLSPLLEALSANLLNFGTAVNTAALLVLSAAATTLASGDLTAAGDLQEATSSETAAGSLDKLSGAAETATAKITLLAIAPLPAGNVTPGTGTPTAVGPVPMTGALQASDPRVIAMAARMLAMNPSNGKTLEDYATAIAKKVNSGEITSNSTGKKFVEGETATKFSAESNALGKELNSLALAVSLATANILLAASLSGLGLTPTAPSVNSASTVPVTPLVPTNNLLISPSDPRVLGLAQSMARADSGGDVDRYSSLIAGKINSGEGFSKRSGRAFVRDETEGFDNSTIKEFGSALAELSDSVRAASESVHELGNAANLDSTELNTHGAATSGDTMATLGETGAKIGETLAALAAGLADQGKVPAAEAAKTADYNKVPAAEAAKNADLAKAGAGGTGGTGTGAGANAGGATATKGKGFIADGKFTSKGFGAMTIATSVVRMIAPAITALGANKLDKSSDNTESSKMIAAAGNGLSMGATGAQMGAMFGPWGAAIGGVIGFAAGFLPGFFDAIDYTATERYNNAKKELEEAEKNSLLKQAKVLNLSSAIDDIKALRKNMYDSEEDMAKYKEAMNNLGSEYPELISAYDESGNAVIDLIKAEQALVSARKESAQADYATALAKTNAASYKELIRGSVAWRSYEVVNNGKSKEEMGKQIEKILEENKDNSEMFGGITKVGQLIGVNKEAKELSDAEWKQVEDLLYDQWHGSLSELDNAKKAEKTAKSRKKLTEAVSATTRLSTDSKTELESNEAFMKLYTVYEEKAGKDAANKYIEFFRGLTSTLRDKLGSLDFTKFSQMDLLLDYLDLEYLKPTDALYQTLALELQEANDAAVSRISHIAYEYDKDGNRTSKLNADMKGLKKLDYTDESGDTTRNKAKDIAYLFLDKGEGESRIIGEYGDYFSDQLVAINKIAEDGNISLAKARIDLLYKLGLQIEHMDDEAQDGIYSIISKIDFSDANSIAEGKKALKTYAEKHNMGDALDETIDILDDASTNLMFNVHTLVEDVITEVGNIANEMTKIANVSKNGIDLSDALKQLSEILTVLDDARLSFSDIYTYDPILKKYVYTAEGLLKAMAVEETKLKDKIETTEQADAMWRNKILDATTGLAILRQKAAPDTSFKTDTGDDNIHTINGIMRRLTYGHGSTTLGDAKWNDAYMLHQYGSAAELQEALENDWHLDFSEYGMAETLAKVELNGTLTLSAFRDVYLDQHKNGRYASASEIMKDVTDILGAEDEDTFKFYEDLANQFLQSTDEKWASKDWDTYILFLEEQAIENTKEGDRARLALKAYQENIINTMFSAIDWSLVFLDTDLRGNLLNNILALAERMKLGSYIEDEETGEMIFQWADGAIRTAKEAADYVIEEYLSLMYGEGDSIEKDAARTSILGLSIAKQSLSVSTAIDAVLKGAGTALDETSSILAAKAGIEFDENGLLKAGENYVSAALALYEANKEHLITIAERNEEISKILNKAFELNQAVLTTLSSGAKLDINALHSTFDAFDLDFDTIINKQALDSGDWANLWTGSLFENVLSTDQFGNTQIKDWQGFVKVLADLGKDIESLSGTYEYRSAYSTYVDGIIESDRELLTLAKKVYDSAFNSMTEFSSINVSELRTFDYIQLASNGAATIENGYLVINDSLLYAKNAIDVFANLSLLSPELLYELTGWTTADLAKNWKAARTVITQASDVWTGISDNLTNITDDTISSLMEKGGLKLTELKNFTKVGNHYVLALSKYEKYLKDNLDTLDPNAIRLLKTAIAKAQKTITDSLLDIDWEHLLNSSYSTTSALLEASEALVNSGLSLNIDVNDYIENGKYKVTELAAKIKEVNYEIGYLLEQKLMETVTSLRDTATSEINSSIEYFTKGTTSQSDMNSFLNRYNELVLESQRVSSVDELFKYDELTKTFKVRDEIIKNYIEGQRKYLKDIGMSEAAVNAYIDQQVLEMITADLDIQSFVTGTDISNDTKEALTLMNSIKLWGILTGNISSNVILLTWQINTYMQDLIHGGEKAVEALIKIKGKENVTTEELEQVYRAEIIRLLNVMDSMEISSGSILTGTAADMFRLASQLNPDKYKIKHDENGILVVEAVTDMVTMYRLIYDEMVRSSEATQQELNSQYAKVLSARDLGNIDAIEALNNAAGMDYETFGSLLAKYGKGEYKSLEYAMQNKDLLGIEELYNGLIRIVDFEALASQMNWTVGSDAYTEAYKTYNDSWIELDRKKAKAINEEVKSILEAKGGDKINVTWLSSIVDEEVINSLLEKYHGQITNGILTLENNADIVGITETLGAAAKQAGEMLPEEMAALEDAVKDYISKMTDAITKGIKGTLTTEESHSLETWAKSQGIIGETESLQFTETTEGLKLSTRQAILLYLEIKKIDSIQGEIAFKELSDSLLKSNDNYKDMASIIAHINELRVLKDTADPTKKKQYEAELEVAERIAAVRATSEDSSFDFMSNKIPGNQNNPLKYFGSWGKAWSTMTEAFKTGGKDKGLIGYEDWYNIVNEMGNLAGLGADIEIDGIKLDGSLTTTSLLILHGIDALTTSTSGEIKVDLGKLGLDFSAGADDLKNGVNSGILKIAKSQVDMLDSMIAMLEVIVQMELLGDLDIDNDMTISVGELLKGIFVDGEEIDKGDWDELTGYITKFGQKYVNTTLAIIKTFTESNDPKMLAALDELKIGINGRSISMRQILEATELDLKDWGISADTLATLMTGFMQMAYSDEFDPDNVWDSFLHIFSGLNFGNATLSVNAGNHEIILNDEGQYSINIDSDETQKRIAEAVDKIKNKGAIPWASTEKITELAKSALYKISQGTDISIDEDFALKVSTGEIAVEVDDDNNTLYKVGTHYYTSWKDAAAAADLARIGVKDENISDNYEVDSGKISGILTIGEVELEVTGDGSAKPTYNFTDGYTTTDLDEAIRHAFDVAFENGDVSDLVKNTADADEAFHIWKLLTKIVTEPVVTMDGSGTVTKKIQEDALALLKANDLEGLKNLGASVGIKIRPDVTSLDDLTSDEFQLVAAAFGIETKTVSLDLSVDASGQENLVKLLNDGKAIVTVEYTNSNPLVVATVTGYENGVGENGQTANPNALTNDLAAFITAWTSLPADQKDPASFVSGLTAIINKYDKGTLDPASELLINAMKATVTNFDPSGDPVTQLGLNVMLATVTAYDDGTLDPQSALHLNSITALITGYIATGKAKVSKALALLLSNLEAKIGKYTNEGAEIPELTPLQLAIDHINKTGAEAEILAWLAELLQKGLTIPINVSGSGINPSGAPSGSVAGTTVSGASSYADEAWVKAYIAKMQKDTKNTELTEVEKETENTKTIPYTVGKSTPVFSWGHVPSEILDEDLFVAKLHELNYPEQIIEKFTETLFEDNGFLLPDLISTKDFDAIFRNGKIFMYYGENREGTSFTTSKTPEVLKEETTTSVSEQEPGSAQETETLPEPENITPPETHYKPTLNSEVKLEEEVEDQTEAVISGIYELMQALGFEHIDSTTGRKSNGGDAKEALDKILETTDLQGIPVASAKRMALAMYQRKGQLKFYGGSPWFNGYLDYQKLKLGTSQIADVPFNAGFYDPAVAGKYLASQAYGNPNYNIEDYEFLMEPALFKSMMDSVKYDDNGDKTAYGYFLDNYASLAIDDLIARVDALPEYTDEAFLAVVNEWESTLPTDIVKAWEDSESGLLDMFAQRYAELAKKTIEEESAKFPEDKKNEQLDYIASWATLLPPAVIELVDIIGQASIALAEELGKNPPAQKPAGELKGEEPAEELKDEEPGEESKTEEPVEEPEEKPAEEQEVKEPTAPVLTSVPELPAQEPVLPTEEPKTTTTTKTTPYIHKKTRSEITEEIAILEATREKLLARLKYLNEDVLNFYSGEDTVEARAYRAATGGVGSGFTYDGRTYSSGEARQIKTALEKEWAAIPGLLAFIEASLTSLHASYASAPDRVMESYSTELDIRRNKLNDLYNLLNSTEYSPGAFAEAISEWEDSIPDWMKTEWSSGVAPGNQSAENVYLTKAATELATAVLGLSKESPEYSAAVDKWKHSVPSWIAEQFDLEGSAFLTAFDNVMAKMNPLEVPINLEKIADDVEAGVANANPAPVQVSTLVSGSGEGEVSGNANATGTAYAGGTLVGELGPELVVSNGRYFIVGLNGPEMVNLADDAIIFNHLLTKSLLERGMSSSRGRAITNEQNAIAFSKGNADNTNSKKIAVDLNPVKVSLSEIGTIASNSAHALESNSNATNTALNALKISANELSNTQIVDNAHALSMEAADLENKFNRVNYEANEAKWHIRTLGEYSGQAEHPVRELGENADEAKEHVAALGSHAGDSESGIDAMAAAASAAAGELSKVKAPSIGGLFSSLLGGNAQAKGTLMGELGPELVVSNGLYFVVGQNGPEMVNLPSDAIVFNHLQTKSLLQKGMSSGRGLAVTTEANAVAYAKGSRNGGPALASAASALESLKQLRAMWSKLAEMSVEEFATKGGGGGGGGNNDAFIKALERWYDLLQEIALLEKEITYEQSKRSRIASDYYKNGYDYYNSLRTSLEELGKEVLTYKELFDSQSEYFEQRRAEMNSALNPFTALYTFDESGQLKYKDGAYKLLTELASSDALTGKPNHTIEEQYNLLLAWGYGEYMKYDSSGKEIDVKDEAGKKSAISAFWAKIDSDKQEMQELHNSIEDSRKAIEEKQLALNDLLKEIEDNQISLENRVLLAIESAALREIDEMTDQKEAILKSNEDLISGLSEALSNERKLYENQENDTELVSLLRQLAVLKRSGGSASEIKSLLDLIDDKSRDIYFTKLQEQIDALQLASNTLIEKLQEQIDIATESLEYLKEHGLLWEQVYEVMNRTPEEITKFIADNDSEFWGKSEASFGQETRLIKFEAEQWKAFAEKDGITGIKGLVTEIAKKLGVKVEEEKEKTTLTNSMSNGGGSGSKNGSGSGNLKTWTIYDEKGFKTSYTVKAANKESALALAKKTYGSYYHVGGEDTGNYTPTPTHGYSFSFNGKKYKQSGFKTLLLALSEANKKINALASTLSGFNEYTKKSILDSARSSIQAYATGGMDYQTGLAMLHGTFSRPEAVLNAELTATLRNDILGSNRNSLLNLLIDFRNAYTGLNDSAYNSINNTQGIVIENATVQMNVEQLANDYDALRAGEQALQKMLDIARKTSANNSVRR